MRAVERAAGLIEYYGRSFKFTGSKDRYSLIEGQLPKWTLIIVTEGKFKDIIVQADTLEAAKEKLIKVFKFYDNRKI